MKKIVVLVIVAVLLIQNFVIADEYYPPIEVVVDGDRLPTFDVEQGFNTPAILYRDRTLLPLRLILKVFGIPDENIRWNGEEQTVTIVAQGDVIVMYIDQAKVMVNGKETAVFVPPILYNNRTYIPVTMVSSLLGETYEWDGENDRVLLNPSLIQIKEYDLTFELPKILGYNRPYRVSSSVGYKLDNLTNENNEYIIIKSYEMDTLEALKAVAKTYNVTTKEYTVTNVNTLYYQYKFGDNQYSSVLSKDGFIYEIESFGLTPEQLDDLMRTFKRGD